MSGTTDVLGSDRVVSTGLITPLGSTSGESASVHLVRPCTRLPTSSPNRSPGSSRSDVSTFLPPESPSSTPATSVSARLFPSTPGSPPLLVESRAGGVKNAPRVSARVWRSGGRDRDSTRRSKTRNVVVFKTDVVCSRPMLQEQHFIEQGGVVFRPIKS